MMRTIIMMIVIGDDKDGGRLSSSYKEYEVYNLE